MTIPRPSADLTPNARKLLTVREVAERLGRSEEAIRWQIHIGALKFGKVAGRLVMRESDLEKVIDAAFSDAA